MNPVASQLKPGTSANTRLANTRLDRPPEGQVEVGLYRACRKYKCFKLWYTELGKCRVGDSD